MRKIYLSAILLLILTLSLNIASAITVTTCSQNLVVKYSNVPSVVQKQICVENKNSYPILVTFEPSSSVQSMLSFSTNPVTVNIGEKKYVTFNVAVNQDTTTTGTINQKFEPAPGYSDNMPYGYWGSSITIQKATECNSGELGDCTVDGCAGQKLCTDGSWGACEKVDPNCNGCAPNWQYSVWTECVNNQQTRTATDLNNCGTNEGKGLTFQTCGTACTESWTYSGWSACTGGQQTRTATDANTCGTTEDRQPLSQQCSGTCTESWICTGYGSCQPGNTKSQTCTDSNACGTTNTRPALTQSCTYSSGSSGGGGGGGGGGGSRRGSSGGSSGGPSLQPDIGISTSRSWASIEPGKYSFEVIKEGLDITWMEFDAGNTKTGVKLSFTSLYNKPATVPALDNLYKYFEIAKTNLDESDFTSSITIRFKVPKEWFTENGFDPESVVFSRYSNGKWNELVTKQLSEDDDYFYYEATTPGLSYFAVTADKVEDSLKETDTVAEVKEATIDGDTENGVAENPENPGVAQITGAVAGEPNQNTADVKGGKNIFGLAVILTIIAGLFLLIEKLKN
ncbi:MAG: PGF-pre-PGF domain-containing protein [archaeon]